MSGTENGGVGDGSRGVESGWEKQIRKGSGLRTVTRSEGW